MGYWTINFKIKVNDKDNYKKVKNYIQSSILRAIGDSTESYWSNWDDLEYNDKAGTITGYTDTHFPNDLIEIARSIRMNFGKKLQLINNATELTNNNTNFIIDGCREYSVGGGLSDFLIELKDGELTLSETDWYDPYYGDVDNLKSLIQSVIEECDLSDEYYDELEDIEDINDLRDFCEENGIFENYDVDLDQLFCEDSEICFNVNDKKIYVNETPEYREPVTIDDRYEWV